MLRRVLPQLLTLAWFASGCSSSNSGPATATPPPASAAPTAAAQPAHAAAPLPTPAAAAPAPAPTFACCATEQASKVLAAYLDAQVALAKDDDRAAATALSALEAATTGAPPSGELDSIRTAAAEAARASSLADRRKPFKALSKTMIAYARTQTGGARLVREAWCPMAPGGWLQESSTIANPYYGAEMLTCGTFK